MLKKRTAAEALMSIITEEISFHKRQEAGSSGHTATWEDGFISGMNHLLEILKDRGNYG
jgi:hypothetical protein